MKEKTQEQSPAKKKQRKVRTPKKRDNNGQQDVEEEANPKQEPKKADGAKPKAVKSTSAPAPGRTTNPLFTVSLNVVNETWWKCSVPSCPSGQRHQDE